MRRILPLFGVFLAGVVLSAVISAAVVSAGSPQTFNDVSPSHPFFDEIEAVANDCITGGYADGGFHPDDPVTRQAMAAFLYRAESRTLQGKNVGIASPPLAASNGVYSAWMNVASVTVSIPDLPGNCMVPVEVHGMASLYTSYTQANACYSVYHCSIQVSLSAGDTYAHATFARVTSDYYAASFSPSTVFEQADGTTVTYYLRVRGYDVKPFGLAVDGSRAIVATTHPGDAFTIK